MARKVLEGGVDQSVYFPKAQTSKKNRVEAWFEETIGSLGNALKSHAPTILARSQDALSNNDYYHDAGSKPPQMGQTFFTTQSSVSAPWVQAPAFKPVDIPGYEQRQQEEQQRLKALMGNNFQGLGRREAYFQPDAQTQLSRRESMNLFQATQHVSDLRKEYLTGFGTATSNPSTQNWAQAALRGAQKPISHSTGNMGSPSEQIVGAQNTVAQQYSGTRPNDENGALFQAMTRANEIRDAAGPKPKPKPKPKPPTLHNPTYLNQQQQFLNRLFQREVFNRTDMKYPYDMEKGYKIDDKNIARLNLIANWILFRKRSSSTLNPNVLGAISPEQARQFDIAGQLHQVLKRNEDLPRNMRDDAKAFADCMSVLIKNNTFKGTVNEAQLIKDMKFFMIDQSQVDPFSRLINRASQFKESSAAFNLGGGPRLGTFGWKQKYWDHGLQVDEKNDPINQAHHFTAFFIEGLKNPDLAQTKSFILDVIMTSEINQEDLNLAEFSVSLSEKIRAGEINWANFPAVLYKGLKN